MKSKRNPAIAQFNDAFDELATNFRLLFTTVRVLPVLEILDFFCSDYKRRCVLGRDAVHFGHFI